MVTPRRHANIQKVIIPIDAISKIGPQYLVPSEEKPGTLDEYMQGFKKIAKSKPVGKAG